MLGRARGKFFAVAIAGLLLPFLTPEIYAQSACVQSTASTWINKSLTTQAAQFTATFDATPSQATEDTVVGFSLNSATAYANLAAIVRFPTTGAIDARNGAAYSAAVSVPYSAGSSYHFRLVINPGTKTYSVYVTPPGQSEIALATGYAFRSEQSSTSSLNNWAIYALSGGVSVCNMAVTAPNAAPAITSQPANQTVVTGQTATFSVGATGTTPLTYQWRKNGASITGATAASYTTAATTTADSGSQFSVVLSNSSGTVTSNIATLTVSSSQNCPCTIWTSNAVPAVADGGADSPVELGVTLRSDVSGYISGIRFYKSTANTGTHVGNLWSSTGTLLASATFSSETASGWQQVSFANPVAITANTSYVASYHANSGHYSADANYFATSGVDTTPLHAVANLSGAADGPYTYGSTSAFPTTTFKATNYWVDVVFVNTIAPTAPAITSQPTSTTVAAGQTASFSVGASGTTPMTYQWRKNGANISGATSSSYTTPATSTADNGALFSVVVGNSAGSATSGNATLTVGATTKTLTLNPTSLSFGNVNTGSSSTLSTTVTNTGNSNVTISSVSVSGAGFTVSGVSTGQIIGAGKSATLNVQFAPASTGSVTGSAVLSSDASNSPNSLALSGAGVQLLTHSSNLSWIASTSTVMGYNVYSATVAGGPYTKLTTTPASGITYKDSTVQTGKTYYYVVTAVNSGNTESVYSNQVTAVIP